MRAVLACVVLACTFLCSESLLATASSPGDLAVASQRRAAAWPVWMTRDQVKALVRDCEDRSDKFKRSFAGALRDSVLAGRPAEDFLNQRAKTLEMALDRTRQGTERNNLNEAKAGVRQAVAVGKEINRAIRARRLHAQTEEAWVALRAEINALARLFRLGVIG